MVSDERAVGINAVSKVSIRSTTNPPRTRPSSTLLIAPQVLLVFLETRQSTVRADLSHRRYCAHFKLIQMRRTRSPSWLDIFPTELDDEVLGYLEGNPKTLSQAALVCRRWLAVSRVYLYRDVKI